MLACLYFLVSDHPWVTIFLATTLIRAPFSQWMSTFFFCINSWKWVSLLINFQQKQFLFVFYQTLDLIFRLFSEKVWIYHLKAIILVLLVLQCLMCIIKISHLLKKIYIYLTSWKDSWQNIECLFIATYTLLKWYLVGTTRHYFLLIL